MKLNEMRECLARHGIQLTKSLGQNFLHDARQLERIVALAELERGDKVLEIGPGLGPLTSRILEKAGEVLAIEKDGRLVQILETRLADHLRTGENRLSPQLKIIHADALHFLEKEPMDWSDWKLVSNLPYSVASPILVQLAAGPLAPRRVVATLQLEVAQRLFARTDDDDYGILTLLIQLDFEPVEMVRIPPGCFFPPPDVESACVALKRRPQSLIPVQLRPVFRKIVKRAFSQRRKMMLKLLKQDWPRERLEAALLELGISPMERAEKLGLEEFIALTQLLAA